MDSTGIKIFHTLLSTVGLNPYLSLAKRSLNQINGMPLYNLLLTLLIIVLTIFCAISFFFRDGDKERIDYTYNIIQLIPNFSTFVISIMCAFLQKSSLMNIIDNFRRIDYELKKYISTSSTYYLKSRRRMDIFYITGIVVCCLFFSLLTGLTAPDLSKKDTVWPILDFIGFALPKFALTVFVFHYSGFVIFILERIKLINKEILGIKSKRKQEYNQSIKDKIAFHFFKDKTDTKSNTQRTNFSTDKQDTDSSNRRYTVQEFQDLFGIIQLIQESHISVNQYFGKQMAMYFLSCLVTLTLQMNYITDNMTGEEKALAGSMMNGVLICQHLMEITMILMVGTKVQIAWKKLYYNIVVQSTDDHNEENFGVLDEIIRTMNLKPIEFNAYSLFNLDLTIVTGIATALATFLVVLVQFKFTLDQKSNSTREAKSAYSASYASSLTYRI